MFLYQTSFQMIHPVPLDVILEHVAVELGTDISLCGDEIIIVAMLIKS